MSRFDDELFDDCLSGFAADEPASRNEVLVAAQEQLRLMTHRMLSGFPGVRRLEDTDDVLQLALVRMDRTLRQLKVNSATDFFRLAALHIRFELINLARRYRNHIQDYLTPNPNDDNPARIPAELDTSTWEPSRLAQWEEFHQTVETLSESEKQVFDLIWYQGLTKTQAAKVLGITLDQARHQWATARLHLIRKMGGDLPI